MQGLGIEAFCQTYAVGATQECVVPVNRRGQTQQGLQQALDVRGFEQVFTADDVGDPLQGVVQGDGQMVGDPDILPRQDDIARKVGTRGDESALTFRAGAFLPESQVCKAAEF